MTLPRRTASPLLVFGFGRSDPEIERRGYTSRPEPSLHARFPTRSVWH
jgi:hypothetical protein